MSHKIEKRFKVLRGESTEDITDKINDFCKCKKVLSVNVSACDHNLQGTGLRSADYTLVYIATIAFEVDATEEKIQEELTAFIERNLKDICPPCRVGENFEGRIQMIVNNFIESDKYKNFEKELRKKYEGV